MPVSNLAVVSSVLYYLETWLGKSFRKDYLQKELSS